MTRARAIRRIALVTAVGCAVLGAATAATASNSVPPSRLSATSVPVAYAALAPPECAGLPLATLLIGTKVNGTKDGDWIVGTPGDDVLDGKQGDDCIDGTGGADEIDGGAGFDVCVGSAASRFRRCEVIVIR